jgi:TRAP-type mannitol/chloroaromatic compound transport system permease large subunit
VALNLQSAFLSPPMAMAAYYLKGIAPPRVTLIQIFNGCYPFLALILLAMVMVYVFPGLTTWLPNLIYG